MDSLFPMDVESERLPNIPGLFYYPDYIDASEEAALTAAIDAEVWDTSWERRRQPYGAGYGRNDKPVAPLPAWGRALAERLLQDKLTDRPFDQMLVNEYLPGQGIAMHRDYDPYDRTVASLSLLTPCVMDFRHVKDSRHESLLLARRSLLVLQDDARYHWEHGIARRKNDVWQGVKIPRARRLSVTFRTLKQEA